MKEVTWAQIIVKWTDEDGEYHEAYFENVHQLANTLRAFRDLGEYLDYVPKKKKPESKRNQS